MKGFAALDPQSHEGETNTWLTPIELIKPLGEFDLDPCGYEGHPTAKSLYILPTDGLIEPWFGRVWLNPPYGKSTGLWLERLAEHGNGIALVFARTETKWFQAIMRKASGILFYRGRIKFLRPSGEISSNAGSPSCFISFGPQNREALSRLPGVMMEFK